MMQSVFYSPKLLIRISFLIIICYFAPLLYLGENATILIHDNLDSNLVWVKLILSNNKFFAPDDTVPQILNGIKYSSLYGVYDLSLIWFKMFGIFYGYILNKFIMSCCAFIGMYLLLKKITPKKQFIPFIIVGTSLLFALLPFWSFTLSVCGLPLVLWAFLSIRDREKKGFSWCVILVFPFYSSLTISGIFLISILIAILIYDLYKSKRLNFSMLIGMTVFGLMYVISHFPLFYSFLFSSGDLSHRIEMVNDSLNLTQSYAKTKTIFGEGQYHAHSLHNYIIYPIIFILFLQYFLKVNNKKYTAIFLFIVLTSLLYGFLNWEHFIFLKTAIWNVIPIQIDRFHFLHPMFWYVLLGICLTIITTKWKSGKWVAIGILVFQMGFILKKHELITEKNSPTYKQFYAEDVFDAIKGVINRPIDSYKVMSVGMHPSIAQYNGFYSLDGYVANYPLEYKHQFREIISNELDKNLDLKKYFDNWGSRCYAFSSELGKDFMNPTPPKIKNLDFDYDIFQQMGGEYIFSSAEIETNNESLIELLGKFSAPDSFWTIHLYKVKMNV